MISDLHVIDYLVPLLYQCNSVFRTFSAAKLQYQFTLLPTFNVDPEGQDRQRVPLVRILGTVM
jgi:hypothetical protein